MPQTKTIEATLAAEAQAWCKMITSRNPTIVNLGPVARILNETTQQDCLLVRAVMYFQTWGWPQSGSGWGDYYFRVVEMTFVNDAKSAERVLDEHRIHVTEYQDESIGRRHWRNFQSRSSRNNAALLNIVEHKGSKALA